MFPKNTGFRWGDTIYTQNRQTHSISQIKTEPRLLKECGRIKCSSQKHFLKGVFLGKRNLVSCSKGCGPNHPHGCDFIRYGQGHTQRYPRKGHGKLSMQGQRLTKDTEPQTHCFPERVSLDSHRHTAKGSLPLAFYKEESESEGG